MPSPLDSSSRGLCNIAGPVLETQPYDSAGKGGTSIHALMHHTAEATDPMLSSFSNNSVWELACGHPFLLASILAVAASHLSYHTADPTQHRLAESALLSSCLKTFRPALAQPLTATRSDALLMTSMLLNNLAFSRLETLNPMKSWVFDDREDRLSWLSIQMGLKPLLVAAAPFRDRSLLGPMYEGSDDEGGHFSGEGASLDRVPAHWLRLAIGMDESVDVACRVKHEMDETQPFREAVRLLAEIRQLPASADNFFLYASFFKALDGRFVDLLYAHDKGALWMLGYWLGLMERLDMWWCTRRARRDWTAIHEFLLWKGVGKEDGQDGEMWRELMGDFESVQPPDTV